MVAPITKPAPGRVPPHSVEAEEQLLAACFIDGPDVITKADAAGIEPDAFYVPANRLIFAKLLELHAAAKPTELHVVAEELKKAKQLDDLGGVAYLVRVSERVATTAGAAYFIEKVREHAERRKVIQAAAEAIEKAHAAKTTEDIEALLAPLKGLGEGRNPVAERVRQAMLDTRKPPAEPQPRWLIDHKPVCTPGNLSAIVAQAKSGKTAFVGAFIAAAIVAERQRMGEDCDRLDTLGVTANAPAGRVLIHFDTEQSPFDHYKTVLRACCRAGVTSAPDWLWSFTCAGWSAADLRRALAEVVRRTQRKGVQIFGLILDGVADFCSDVNDSEECNALVAELHARAIEAGAPIINVVHRNEGEKADSAARGHLGKQLARKCETNLRLEKREGKTVVFSERNRGAPILEKDGPCFEWSEEKGYHVSCASISATRAELRSQELADLAAEIFTDSAAFSYSALRDRIMAVREISKKRAETWIKVLRSSGVIMQADGGRYVRKP